MAEFMEIIKTKDRICEQHKGRCITYECPLCTDNNGKINCESLLRHDPEEYERICLDWAKKNPNPELTNKGKLYEVLKETFGEQIAHTLIPKLSCDLFDCEDMKCDHCCYDGFWDKPYIEPKEVE